MKPSQYQERMASIWTQIQRGLSSGAVANGFTLIELMITVAVLGILLAIAVPSFMDAVLGSKLSSAANSLVANAYLARGEAIKRNAVVQICTGSSCPGSGDWEQGWIVQAADGTVIQRQSALAPGLKMSGAGVSTISFQPSGVGSTPTTLIVCRATPSVGSQERVITISATGRPSVAKTENGSCP